MAGKVSKGDKAIALNNAGAEYKVVSVSEKDGVAELERVLAKPPKAEAESNLVVKLEDLGNEDNWTVGD